ncbi:recombination-associated protein RdgC, partial [Parachitinimonas caeni]
RALVEPQTGWVWVDTSSASRAETLLSLLREALEHLPSRLLHTQQSPVTVMTNWLENGADEGFTLDADCELKAPGDEGAVIRCRR